MLSHNRLFKNMPRVNLESNDYLSCKNDRSGSLCITFLECPFQKDRRREGGEYAHND